MEELIPLLVWGALIFIFSSGGRKKQKEKARLARQARLEARRQRMEADQAAGGFGADATAVLTRPDAERSPRSREPRPLPAPRAERAPSGQAEARRTPPPARRSAPEPQMPKDIWEMIELLARGGVPRDQGPSEPVEEIDDPFDAAELGYRAPEPEPTPEPLEPTVGTSVARSEQRRPARRSIQAVAEARSDAGISGVDAEEHAAEQDPTLTDADAERHSRVEAAVARARSRRKAGTRRERRAVFGRGLKDVRRAIIVTEVLGTPVTLRSGPDPHQPPE